MASRNKAPRGSKTSWSQYAVMVNFLEIPFNFNLVNGKGTDNLKGKGVVARKPSEGSTWCLIPRAIEFRIYVTIR